MADSPDFFKNKKITVVGLGLLGRGVGDVRFLAECGAELTVTDLKSTQELAPSLEMLKEFPNIRYTLGEHRLEDFEGRDLIVNGPKVPLDSPYIARAREQGIPITMSTALFARLARARGATLVGVTGTRGKTTTTTLIAEVLRASGKKVLLGGNIQGVSTLSLLPETTADTIAVLELDSWQLQGFREEQISPDVAVFTTLYPDHLDYYKGDMAAYLADKAEIFLHQKAEDTLVLGEQCEALIQEHYGRLIRANRRIARAADVPADWKLRMPGVHNRQNASCALLALEALGISADKARSSIEQFEGVPGRLQFVREFRGVNIYNDTTATTPEATIAALQALDPREEKNIILIMGGADKGLVMDALLSTLPLHCKKILLLSGTGTRRMQETLPDAPVYDSLEKAVVDAATEAKEGDHVLFSPAFASFGMFKNEYDRGEAFLKAVSSLS